MAEGYSHMEGSGEITCLVYFRLTASVCFLSVVLLPPYLPLISALSPLPGRSRRVGIRSGLLEFDDNLKTLDHLTRLKSRTL